MRNLKITFLLIFLVFSISAQNKTDSIPKTTIKTSLKKGFFSDKDLSVIDSLVVETQYKSPLTDNINYVIKGLEAKEQPSVKIPTNLLKERLKHLDNTSPFFIEYNPILENVINSYLKYRKKYYPSLMAKAEYYFPMFEKYLDQFDVPLEMKYLAIVESALDPRARSRVGARGLWQFMYLTGKQYKLNVSSYVDERQDPIKATIAACKYLSRFI